MEKLVMRIILILLTILATQTVWAIEHFDRAEFPEYKCFILAEQEAIEFVLEQIEVTKEKNYVRKNASSQVIRVERGEDDMEEQTSIVEMTVKVTLKGARASSYFNVWQKNKFNEDRSKLKNCGIPYKIDLSYGFHRG